MPVPLVYTMALIFTILLFLTYAALDQQFYYSAPLDSSPDILPGIYMLGAIAVGNTTMKSYELATSSHAPLKSDKQKEELKGYLTFLNTADDAKACAPLLRSDLSGSIAMVERGGCSLLLKIANCQDQGAKAVVFGDLSDVETDAEEQFGVKDQFLTGIDIPAMVLPPADFRKLSRHQGEEAVLWTLSPDIDLSVLRLMLLLFIRPIIMLTVLLLFLLVNMQNKKRKKRSTPELVRSLPTRQWNPEIEGTWHQRQCSICLDDFSNDCEIMTLPCRHEFHKGCVSQWLTRRRGVCPLCLQEVQGERIPLLRHAPRTNYT